MSKFLPRGKVQTEMIKQHNSRDRREKAYKNVIDECFVTLKKNPGIGAIDECVTTLEAIGFTRNHASEVVKGQLIKVYKEEEKASAKTDSKT